MKSLFSKQCVQEFLIYFTLIFYCYGLWVTLCHHPHTTLLCHDRKSDLACEQALRSDTAMGWEKEGELATMSLEFEFHLQIIPLWLTINCQISTNQCEAETIANVNKHWKPRARGNYAITTIISANQHFHRLFWCRYSNSRDLVPSSPSFSCPATREFQRACLRAKSGQ